MPAAKSLNIGVVQLKNEGDLQKNRDKILRFITAGVAAGCRLVVFPEAILSFDDAHPATALAMADAS